jgi:hypothetical protein
VTRDIDHISEVTPPFPGFDRLGVRLGSKHQPKIGSNYPFETLEMTNFSFPIQIISVSARRSVTRDY